MLNPKNRDGFDAQDAKFLEIVDRFGWHVMHVAPRPESNERQEWFSYSTGLFRKFGVPEIILFGVGYRDSIALINEIGKLFEKGTEISLDVEVPGIFANDVKCVFRKMDVSWYAEYVGFSQWFYEDNNFPVWQCFWPDKAGKYPWEVDCNSEVAELQPRLYEPKR